MPLSNDHPPTVTVLLGDPRLADDAKPGGRFTEDDYDQVARLRQALAELSDFVFEYRDDHVALLEDLRARRPAFALNFCDTGFRNRAHWELHVPALLEMLDIPYSGSGPLSLGLCYDKALVRSVAAAHGLPVPWEVLVGPSDPVPDLELPAFVKPNRGDGSVGITEASVTGTRAEVVACVGRLRRERPGADVLVQELLCGAEYGVGIVGNPGADFTVLPVLEVDYDALDPALPRLLAYASKVDPASPYWRDVRFRAARLDPETLDRLGSWCETLFTRLGLRDYARFDFRADAAGHIKLVEVNPNPAWCWDGKLAHMASLAGLGHAGMLRLIVAAALKRCFGH